MPGENPIDDLEERLALEERCAALGRMLGDQMPKGVGFALMLFDFGEDGNFAYMSNADRTSMLEMFREAIVKLGGTAS